MSDENELTKNEMTAEDLIDLEKSIAAMANIASIMMNDASKRFVSQDAMSCLHDAAFKLRECTLWLSAAVSAECVSQGITPQYLKLWLDEEGAKQ